MSTQTQDSDSPSAAGFQLGYLHKQADYADDYTLDDYERANQAGHDSPAEMKREEKELQDWIRSWRDNSADASTNNFGYKKLTLRGDPESEPDDYSSWGLPELALQRPIQEVDPTETGSLQMAKYEPAKTEGSLTSTSPNNREKVRSILSELAPGAAIGGTAGVGLSLAQDAKKGEGVRLGKAVGMGVGGAAAGALIQALAKRQKLRATALA